MSSFLYLHERHKPRGHVYMAIWLMPTNPSCPAKRDAGGLHMDKVEFGNGGNTNFSQVLDLIYGIVPTNLLEPFVTGNPMQLIFIAVMVGIAMLTLSSRVAIVFSLVEQISSIVQTIMVGLSSILPVMIFVLFTGMISGGNLEVMIDSWKMLLLSIILMIIFYVINLLQIAVRKKVSPRLLFKKACYLCRVLWFAHYPALVYDSLFKQLVSSICPSSHTRRYDDGIYYLIYTVGHSYGDDGNRSCN